MRQNTTKHLYSYWNEVRGARMAPRRFDIEPAQIASILPETFVLERCADGQFRFRLAGTRICESFGREFRGLRMLDLWPPADQPALEELLAGSMQLGGIGVIDFAAHPEQNIQITCEVLLLPLLHTGNEVDRVLGSFAMAEQPYWLGVTPLIELSTREINVIWPDGRPFPMNSCQDGQTPLLSHPPYSRLVTSDRRSFRVYDGGLSKDR